MRNICIGVITYVFHLLVSSNLYGQAPVISGPLSVNGTVGLVMVNYIISASNSPATFDASNLPAGLTFNGVTGTISGTPLTAGTFNAVISATNTSGTDTKTLVFTIAMGSQQITGLGATDTKTYGDAPYPPGASASSGLVVSYTSSNTAVATILGSNIVILGQGTTTITASQSGNADYNAAAGIVQVLTVNKKVLTVTGTTIAPKPYDGTTISGDVQVGALFGLIGNESITVTATGMFADPNAANNKPAMVTYILADGTNGGLGGNYILSNEIVPGNIVPKPLAITGTLIRAKIYDGTAQTGQITTGKLSGFVGKETVRVLTATGLFNDAMAGIGKTAIVTYTLANETYEGLASNYSLANDTLKGDILPKNLTVSGTTIAPKVYDGSAVSGLVTVGTVSGFIGGETVVVTGTGAFTDANAGNNKTATVNYLLADGSNNGFASNYRLSVDTLSGNILSKGLSISGTSIAPKVYDGTTKAGTISPGTLSGLIGTETITVAASGIYSDANAGIDKTATIAYTLQNGANGGLAQNYTLLNEMVTGNITQAPLTIAILIDTIKCSSDSIAFDNTNYKVTGLVQNEKIARLSLSPAGSPANDPIGPGIHEHYIGANPPVGSDTTSPTIFINANYNITVERGKLTINKTPKLVMQTDTVCSDATFVLSPSNTNGNDFSDGTTYSWPVPSGAGFAGGISGTNQNSISGRLTNISENNMVTATYRVVPTTGNCTGDTFTVLIVVKHLPSKPQISNMPAILQLCQNSTQSFTASAANSFSSTSTNNDIAYTWLTNANLVATSSGTKPAGKTVLIQFPGAGPYLVKVTDSVLEKNGCTNDTTFIIAPLGAAGKPYAIIYNGIDFVCLNNNVNASIDGYQWGYDTKDLLPNSFTANEAPFVTAQNLTRPITDTAARYIWVITKSGSCFTKTYFNTPHGRAGIVQPTRLVSASPINIYPNPVSREAVITWRYTNTTDAATITISDMAGRRVYTRLAANITPGRAVINVSALPKGLYLVNIRLNGKGVAVAKFVKE